MTSRNTFSNNGSLKKALKEALTQHIENNDPTTVFIIHETQIKDLWNKFSPSLPILFQLPTILQQKG